MQDQLHISKNWDYEKKKYDINHLSDVNESLCLWFDLFLVFLYEIFNYSILRAFLFYIYTIITLYCSFSYNLPNKDATFFYFGEYLSESGVGDLKSRLDLCFYLDYLDLLDLFLWDFLSSIELLELFELSGDLLYLDELSDRYFISYLILLIRSYYYCLNFYS